MFISFFPHFSRSSYVYSFWKHFYTFLVLSLEMCFSDRNVRQSYSGEKVILVFRCVN